MVLESLVANVLNRVLGMYVHNFDPKQLNIGIWNQQIKLHKLQLRKEALDQLHLPLNVLQGYVGELTLSIPFRNLRGEPVKAVVEDVYILAAPREDADINVEEEEARANKLKMEKLESAELLKARNAEGMSKEEQQQQQGFVASLTTAIVDNLQIFVKNIHIRYEDNVSHPGHPFAAGLTLNDFSAESTDENWKPGFILNPTTSTHKLAKLGALAVYWDTDTTLIGPGKATGEPPSIEEVLEKFQDMANDDPAKKQYILKPVSGQAGLELDKTGKTDVPKMNAKIFFDELGFVLDEDQYRDSLMLVDLFHYFIRHQETKKIQPKMAPRDDPSAWFRFVGQVVRDRIHDRNKRWSWAYFAERRDDRVRYIELFKKKKKEEKLSPQEIDELNALEKKSGYEDLRFWRSLARNQLRKENVGVKKPPPKQTWGQWMFGGGQQEDQEETMTEEQRNELFAAIDFDERKAISDAVDLPKETVKMRAQINLQTGSFTLRRDPHGKKTEILKLLFESFNATFIQRPNSSLTSLSLQGLRLIDGTTDGNLFPETITVKNAPALEDPKAASSDSSTDAAAHTALNLNDDDASRLFEKAFFAMTFEQRPIDGSADSAVNLKLRAMEVVYNPKFVVEVFKFFKPPERHMESIGALMDSAGEAVEGLRKQTRAGLEFALEEHKTINAHFDLQAPLIIVPDSVVEESSNCLILDAGHISVNSDLVDRKTLQDVQAKHKQQYSDKDYKELENLMYDKFILKLESTQVLIGPSIHSTRAQLEGKADNAKLHLIDRINMDFLVETCILTKDTDLTKLRVTGKLPILHASISDQKYKNLMRLIEVAVPKFDTESKKLSSGQSGLLTDGLPVDYRRPRSKSFQFAAQQYELIAEEEERDQDKQQAFHDASQSHQPTAASANRRNFEFKFVVEKLQGSLYKSNPEQDKPDSLLAELIAKNFGLEFYQRQHDMVAEVALASLAVEDHVEDDPLPDFRNIVSSDHAASGEQKDLLKVKFIKVQKDSPDFMSVYEGFATNLDVSISTINVIVTRKTLLTLLDFVMVTFTNQDQPNNPSSPQAQIEDNVPAPEQESSQSSADKIRIKAELQQIAVVLNNDGIRLATLSLKTATVALTLMGKSMRLGAKLGDLSLIDDVNQGASKDSPMRQLLTIQGKELADFVYETFDPESDAYPGHDFAVKLRAGSLKVNFVTEPFRKIMEFGVKFGKMQAIFNAARQAAANQAGQMQQRANKMHFDILVSTPIIVFPRAVFGTGKLQRDALTAYLGEIYAMNKFVPLDDSKDADTSNELSLGIRNVKLESLLHYDEGKSEVLEVIDKVDLGFNITKVEHKPEYKRPDWEIDGKLSDINLRLTAPQLKLAMGLARSIPQAFATQPDDEMEKDVQRKLPDSTVETAQEAGVASKEGPSDKADSSKPSDLGPELGSSSETWTTMDFNFRAGAVGLELIQASEDKPVGDVKGASLSKFSLNETKIKARMVNDGAIEAELQIQSFTIQDTRERETNKFRKIMSLVNSDVSQQFMASFTLSGGDEKNMLVMFTIDSPRVIVALEYVFAIQAFVNSGLTPEQEPDLPTIEEESEVGDDQSLMSPTIADQSIHEDSTSNEPQQESKTSLAFRISLVDAQILLIANAAMANSEAIVLSMKQAVVTQQHALTLQVENVGMFLCRMDRPKQDHLRILDDFSITTSHDARSQTPDSSMTNIHVDVEPLVLRLSLRDIQLAMQIATKAISMTSCNEDDSGPQEPGKVRQIKGGSTIRSGRRSSNAGAQSARSIKTKQTAKTTQPVVDRATGSIILKREEASIHISGIRVVLIGDVHELPILDWSVKAFDIDARDWSGGMTAELSIDTFINIYNFSKSAWEPLFEPWSIGFHMSREQNPQKLSVELFSRKTIELTLTTATIALLYKTMQLLTSDEDVLSKARTTKEPYRIRNYTGFTMSIWASTEQGGEGSAAKLEDGEEIPWRFEDPATTRESLSPEAATGVVGMKLEGSGFDSVNKIPLNREGERVYTLAPRQDGVLHRFLVEIILGTDNIKYITFRSPLVMENNTQIPVELGVYSPDEGHLVKIEKISPGESRPAPVGAAFMHSLLVRPSEGFGYSWSDEKLFWKDLVRKPTSTITCRGEQADAPLFYFQMHAVFESNNPLTKIYPYMRIRLTPPMELHNLLPYDFKYRIYDKNTKRDWTNFLRRGGISPGHVVNVNHLLLLSIELQDLPFKQSDYAVINSADGDFKREENMPVKDNRDLTLRLKLHYYNIPDTGGAFKVSVYSPYVVLNKTGLELDIRSKTFMSAAKAAAGQKAILGASADPDMPEKAKPFMFSFAVDDPKNRAMIKVGDSDWSRPLSFDAIGSDYSTAAPSSTGKSEMQLGVTVAQGEGKYSLAKVVTFTPRFVLRNRLREDILIREPGSSEVTTMAAGSLHPLRFMRQQQTQQLSLCFPGVDNQWSAPFHISNVGRVHVKLAKAKHRQQLIKIEILLEDATLFLHMTQTDQWPFAIRNESDTEFRFHQANPNIEEDEEDRNTNFRPINYRIPPRSIMPYAWDYPASRNKDLVLECQGKSRHVKLAEIGPQKPMAVPGTQGRPKTFGVDVVADGPKQELVISNFKQSLSLYRQKTGGSTRSTTDVGFEVKDLHSDVTMNVNLRLAGVGLSLVNRQFRELIYLTLRDLELKYNDSRLYQTLDWTTKWIQIDNQLYGGIFPILLYPSVVPKTGEQLEAHPIFHAAVTRVKDESYGVLYIKYATLLLQQMTLEIDEDFIFALLDFMKIPGVTDFATETEGKLCDEELDIPEPHKEESGQDVYFELLHLQPVQIDLSFVRTERINAEDTMAVNSPLMFAVNVLTMSLGNVNDAPLRYNALMLENARIAPTVLMTNIQSHFVQESIRQVHVVLGSADILGNPVGLFNNVSSGVADIFYEPYQGLVATDRPQDLGIGIAKGASSFVKKSVFGLSDSLSKVTGSMAKGLAAASLDKEYQDQRRMSKSRNRPKHALYGITAGGNAFANTLASGIGGLARAPLEGAEKEGFGGFVKGVGKGVLGFATKAALAPIDLTSSVFEGVRNTTTMFDSTELDRVRPTRFIATDQIVRPYSQREALGQFWLKTTEDGRYFNEHYIAHLDLTSGGVEMLVMLTYDRIMLIRTEKLAVEWDVPLKDIQRISKERTGMSITLKNSQGPFLPVSDEGQRNFLYRQIAVAVNAYNEKWQAKG